jgi:hypothetical protein
MGIEDRLRNKASSGAATSDRATSGKPAEGPDEAPLLKIATAADVAGIADLKQQGASLNWVWPGWIQRGVVTLIAAEGGTGKTRFAADLVRRARHKMPWPDGPHRAGHDGPTVALWVVSDNHHGEMVTLCEGFGIADCVKVNSHPSDPYGGVLLDTAEDFTLLERRVEVTAPLFVIVDTVGNATDKNLSRQEDAKAFYAPLQVLARRRSVAVLCLTHLNAGGSALGRRGLEKVRVAIRMTAQAAGDPKCKRRLEVTKSNSPYPAPLGVTMDAAGNVYDTDPPPAPTADGMPAGNVGRPPVKIQECMEWLVEQLAEGPQSVKTLRERGASKGFAAQTLYSARHRLKLLEDSHAGCKCWMIAGHDEELGIPE